MEAIYKLTFKILTDHIRAYPKMQLVDAVKLLYQNEFGPGHMLPDRAFAYQRLASECLTANALPAGFDCFIDIGNGLVRYNIGCIEASGISLNTVNNCFCLAANTVKGSMQSFIAQLDALEKMCDSGELPFEPGYARHFIKRYIKDGCPQVHHSIEYKKAYKPAYRVMLETFKQYYRLFCAIDRLLDSSADTVVLGIDGRCLSGKSTLSALLYEIYDCNVFAMDDFFLPAELQTPERLSIPGGNVDIERFQTDVLDKLRSGDFAYRPFDCGSQSLKAPININHKRLNIVEGSYSLHPKLRNYYDLKLLLKIDKAEQLKRLKERNSQESQTQFINKWIPIEENYHTKTKPEAICDLII